MRWEQKCRVCGCTWTNGCPAGCYWVEEDLCSECVGKEEIDDEYFIEYQCEKCGYRGEQASLPVWEDEEGEVIDSTDCCTRCGQRIEVRDRKDENAKEGEKHEKKNANA